MFGLFIDFANAYNTVPHTLLFKKLRDKNCLTKEEIDYLEALYSRFKIRVGSKSFSYNRGVAQGSILSPALFNIFIEDLSHEISKELGISREDILLYADDILVLCTSLDQISRCIDIVDKWAKANGMELNKKKSGIVPFHNKKVQYVPFIRYTQDKKKEDDKPARKLEITRKEFKGVPIVEKYKYLGNLPGYETNPR